MDCLNIEDLARDHLLHYWKIYAYVPGDDFCREVWSSRRLLPFTSAQGAATNITRLYVKVDNLNNDGIDPLIRKLEEIDPIADDRIIRTFSAYDA